MKNATVLKVELVNGSMLTVTTDAPEFDFSVIRGHLNGSDGRFNTWDTDLDIKPGDEITEDGEIIEGADRGGVDETELSGPVARWDHKLDE